MRQAARIDSNHRDIVYALRKVGAVVQSLAAIGKGCPDLLVSYQGKTMLMEVKDGNKPPSQKRLTPDELAWITVWQATVWIVYSVDDALKALEKAK